MDRDLKLCMIGAGGHASRNIYPCFPFLKSARVVANADLDENRARSAAAQFGIPNSYTDYRRMLDAEKPDGVMICVGSDFNGQVVPELLGAGWHVYMEKPTASDLASVVRMRDAARAGKRICMTAYKKRFAPAYRKAKDVVEAEAFGQPVLLSLLRTKGSNFQKEPADQEYLLQWGCHGLDLLPFYFGPVASVHAERTTGSTFGYAVAVRFACGAVGTIAITRTHGGNWEELRLFGSGHQAVTVENSIHMVTYQNDQPIAQHRPSFTQGSSHSSVEQGFVGELQAFVDAIRTGQTPDADIESALHTMAIHEAIQQSAASGRTIEVVHL